LLRVAALTVVVTAILWGVVVSVTGRPPPEGVGGSVFASGSSTVEPITLIVAEKFHEHDPSFGFQVEGPGTGDGFALFCNGETHISNASRPIQPAEIEDCTANGVEFVELLVAYDGLAVITSRQNEEIDCLSFVDLYALVGPESQGFRRWSDADRLAAELEDELGAEYGASHAPYTDAALVITAPGEESGTFDTFVEIAIAPIADERGTDHTTRPDYVASPNDNVIMEGVAGTRSSLGWVGLAFAREAEEAVKKVDVDAGEGCVSASDETVADGSYPIARPLFIYVNLDAARTSAAVRGFVDFYLSDEGLTSADEVGYVDLTPDLVAETREAWRGAVGDDPLGDEPPEGDR
jgi:phosphate transport system substrate-binding protein